MKNGVFEKDDYAEIQRKYFDQLFTAGRVDADPSGWLLTYSDAEKFLQLPQVSPHDFAKYHVDEGRSLAGHKERLVPLLSSWEGRSLQPGEFTLCPSGGCASLVTLATLKALGIKKILFETPAYFATIEQAREVGLQVELLPTYRNDGYELRNVGSKLRHPQIGLWITQPRAALGFDQSCDTVGRWARQIGQRGYVVSDEVTDQTFPSHLSKLAELAPHANVVRIRSFTKGMGLNGLRLATILHSAQLRAHLVDSLETFGGSIDAHSLIAVTKLAESQSRFRRMLMAANAQVNDLRNKAERLVRGSPITVNRLTNGYIGSMIADLRGLGCTQKQRRVRLLRWCSEKCTPVILGSSFYMAQSPPTEAVRLNFFNRRENITRGIVNILQLWEDR
jgi:aspartate/methionine/tyrosine aminotransferase